VSRNRTLVVSARVGRAVARFVFRGLVEAGRSMCYPPPMGYPGEFDDLYPFQPGRLTFRERRLWHRLERQLRRAAAPGVHPGPAVDPGPVFPPEQTRLSREVRRTDD
jgi:hypothetical protein